MCIWIELELACSLSLSDQLAELESGVAVASTTEAWLQTHQQLFRLLRELSALAVD